MSFSWQAGYQQQFDTDLAYIPILLRSARDSFINKFQGLSRCLRFFLSFLFFFFSFFLFFSFLCLIILLPFAAELKNVNEADFDSFHSDFDILLRRSKVRVVFLSSSFIHAFFHSTHTNVFNQTAAEQEAQERKQMRDFTESDKYERTKARNEEFLATKGKMPARGRQKPKTAVTVTADSGGDDDGDDDGADAASGGEAGADSEEADEPAGTPEAAEADGEEATSPGASLSALAAKLAKGAKGPNKKPSPGGRSKKKPSTKLEPSPKKPKVLAPSSKGGNLNFCDDEEDLRHKPTTDQIKSVGKHATVSPRKR